MSEEFTDSADEWDAPVKPLPESEKPQMTHLLFEKMDGVERELAGALVHIVFHLPDGKVIHRDHYMGQTIAYLKAQLDDLDGLAYETVTLFLGDRQLLDPLSLNDLPFKETEENHVTLRLEK